MVAQQHGAQAGQPVILKDTNHTIVHLAPGPIVAKVSVEKRFRQESSSWDLAALDEEGVSTYGVADPSLLALSKTARLFCIVTWCWTQPDRAPEVREAAEYYLEYLKDVRFG